jgi:hypothetical protein
MTLVESLGVGVAKVLVSTDPQGLANGEDLTILPIANFTFIDRLGTLENPQEGTTTAMLSMLLSPLVDVYTGTVNEILQPTATLTARLTATASLRFNAGLVQSIPVPKAGYPLTGLSGGIDLRLRVTRLLDVNLGVQAYWQRQVTPGTIAEGETNAQAAATAPAVASEAGSEIGYLGVTAHLPTLRF